MRHRLDQQSVEAVIRPSGIPRIQTKAFASTALQLRGDFPCAEIISDLSLYVETLVRKDLMLSMHLL